MMDAMTTRPRTSEHDAELAAVLREANAEQAAWSAGVQAGTIPLQGVELAAFHGGLSAGYHGLEPSERRELTVDYTARQRVAWAVGYGQGRARADEEEDR